MTKTSMEVVDHHLEALEQGDLDNLMSDYADDAVMIFPEQTLTGRAAIRDFFTDAIEQYGAQALAGVVPSKKVQADELIYVVWTQHPGTDQAMRGVDNYIVKDGKIKVQAVFDA